MAIPDYKLSTVLCGHSIDVRCVASSKEFCILSASEDHTAKLWHPEGVKDYENIVTYKGHTNFVSSVCWLPPCESFPEGLVVTGSNDNTILGYNLQDGAVVVTLEGHEYAVCFVSPGREPGVLLSSSGDSTAKVWNVNSLTTSPVTLKGHQAAVWSVIELCNGTLATASADKTIALWKKDGTQITVLQGHTDCVRGLTVASQDTFLSCSNDASIRVWTNGGQCLNTYYGHSNHIYSISMNQSVGKNCFATCGEDGCVRVWMDGDCVRSIGVPAQSVWSVACLTNGDIVTGSSDGVVRVFTCDPARFADEVTLKQYEEDMEKMVTASTQKIGGYKLTEIPGCEVLMEPGVTDGQSILVRRGTNVKYYSWSVAEQNWNEIGDVISTNQLTKENTMDQGKQYDEEFSIDIKYVAATDPLELPINKTEDPLAAEQVSFSSNNAFADPLTGESRYVPGCEVTSREPSPVAPDPITGSGASTDKPLISHDSHLRVYEGNLRLIFDKLKEFNSKLGDDLSPLTDDQLKNIAATSLLLNMSVSQQKNNVDLAQCMVQVLNNTTDKEAHFRSAPVSCMVKELLSTEQLERPKTTRKRKYSPSPSASACSRTLQSSTPSPIELADSSSRNNPDLEKGQLSPTTGFWKASEADESLGLSTVLLLPLDKVEVKQDSEVSSPAASVGSSTLGSVPNTPNRSSRQKLTLSPAAPLRPTASKSLFGRGSSSPVSYMFEELPLTEQLEKPKTRRKIKIEIKNEVDVQDSEAFLPAPPAASPSARSVQNTRSTLRELIPSAASASLGADYHIPDQTGPTQVPPVRRNRYEGLSNAEIQAHLALTVDSDDDEEPTNAEFEPVHSHRSRRILEFDDVDEEELEVAADPADRFRFEWRAFSSTPVPPNARRLPFDTSACGPTVDPHTPYDAFVQIWDQPIIEHIVRETNEYAQLTADCRSRNLKGYKELAPTSRISYWKDITVDEFYRFLAILMAMGMVVKTKLEEYWESNTESVTSTPGFSRVIARNRFLLITRCLHFNSLDPAQPPPQSVSRLFKLEPILSHLNRKFTSLYRPARNLALDESLTLWKGLLSIKQINKNKAAAVGVKSYEVCESDTGYLYRFELHAGEHVGSAETPISGTVPSLVLKLLEGLEHKGHTIWMDNYYNSPALARELRNRGFDCVGTLRLNRQFVPLQLTTLTNNDLAPGEVRGCTSGDVDLLVWRGKRTVGLISTYHGLATVIDKGEPKPSIVPDYNLCMGGVDTKDQVLAMYPVERTRQRVWYKKMFRRLLNVSIHNAYIIFKAKHKISHRLFRHNLIEELLRRHRALAPTRLLFPARPSALSTSSIISSSDAPSTSTIDSTPPRAFCSLGRYGKGRARRRRVCVKCKPSKRVYTYCKKCTIFLCAEPCFDLHMAEAMRRPRS